MKTLKFYGFEVTISDEELSKDIFNIDFGGEMMVQFTKQEDETYKPTNAVNGWGYNCYQEISGEELTIKEESVKDDIDYRRCMGGCNTILKSSEMLFCDKCENQQ